MANVVLSVVQTVFGALFSVVVTIIAFLLNGWKPKITVPPIRNPLLQESATSLAKMIRKREVTSSEVVDAFITRIKEVNPIINAVVADRFAEAIQEARDIDTILDSKSIPDRYSEENAPFLGVPFTAKEAFGITGLPNTSGLVARKHLRSTNDAKVISHLRKAGAIPLALTNCSELCMWYESSNCVYGRTNNPYDSRRIVGGSSGGEGAILTAAGSVFGVGSDIGGSIRMPSYFNGIFGHKPSTGIVPNEGQFPCSTGKRSDFLVTGPMCRYVEDLDPMLRVMAGKQGLAKLRLDTPVDLKKLNYFTIEDDGGALMVSSVRPELKAAQSKAVTYLEDQLGVQFTATKIRRLKYSFQMWSSMMTKYNEGQSFNDLMADSGRKVYPMLELFKWLFQASNHTLPAIALGVGEKLEVLMPNAEREKLCQACDKLKADFEELLGNDGVVLYPSHPKVAPFHHSPLTTPFNFAYTGIINMLGFPSTQVPLGLNKDGVPLGVQVIALRNNDHLTLAVAKQLAEGFGGWMAPL